MDGMRMTNVLLCGGSGTRLWPLSRTLMPKQFVKFSDDRSLFQQTVLRNQRLCEDQLIVANTEHYFLAIDQLEAIGLPDLKTRYLLEPMGRNTAPAIALAALCLEPDEVMLVTPSDHLIKDEAGYRQAVERAEVLARDGSLVTFGIVPRHAETGFGYIEAEKEKVLSFKEKPDAVTAESYLKAGNYLWNSGMFCFCAGAYLDALRTYAPEIYKASVQAFESANKMDTMIRIHSDAMMAIPEQSIDYAVMEKSDQVKVVPARMGWSDLGSFDALAEEVPSDANQNLILSSRYTALVDVQNLIVVDTPDALLIVQKGSSQKVKAVVSQLKAQGSQLPDVPVTVHRPWGTYTILDESEGYKVKRIVVRPGKRLSLQKHRHRSEHWVVVRGKAWVTCGKACYEVVANTSTYIPIGQTHRLENREATDLVMIEAQVGGYVGEDDIIRIDDDYHRG
jgi:mannose-1-phosphate guanylyltransferase